jgi:cytochrome c-type biogenesis protein CcmH/NrfF
MAAYLSMVKPSLSKVHLILFSIFFCLSAWATGEPSHDRYHFETSAEEKHYQQLLLHIRCMVCENQSLAESNSPLAEDLRLEVYNQFVAGKTDPEIKAFLVERYGAAVLYEPPIQSNTLILWLGPILLLLIGGLIWIYKVRK